MLMRSGPTLKTATKVDSRLNGATSPDGSNKCEANGDCGGSDIEGFDDFQVDYARTLHWAVIESDLPASVKHTIHVVATLMPKNGSGCWSSLKFLAKATNIPIATMNRLMPELRSWGKIAVESGKGRRANTYTPTISREEVRAQWCKAKQAKWP